MDLSLFDAFDPTLPPIQDDFVLSSGGGGGGGTGGSNGVGGGSTGDTISLSSSVGIPSVHRGDMAEQLSFAAIARKRVEGSNSTIDDPKGIDQTRGKDSIGGEGDSLPKSKSMLCPFGMHGELLLLLLLFCTERRW